LTSGRIASSSRGGSSSANSCSGEIRRDFPLAPRTGIQGSVIRFTYQLLFKAIEQRSWAGYIPAQLVAYSKQRPRRPAGLFGGRRPVGFFALGLRGGRYAHGAAVGGGIRILMKCMVACC